MGQKKRKSSKQKQASSRTLLKRWSKAVRERDGNKCFVCGSTERLNSHHVLPKRLWSKYKFDPEIGVCLCIAHHAFGKFSCHRGVGDMLLFMKMQKERPEQFNYIMEIINNECKNQNYL